MQNESTRKGEGEMRQNYLNKQWSNPPEFDKRMDLYI